MEPLETPPVEQPKSPWRPNRLTSGIVAGGAAFAMVLAGLGIASAQTDDSSTTTPPAASADAGPGPGHHHGHHPGDRPSLAVAATTLGMSEADLKAELQSGKTLAEIAGAKTDALIAALVKDAEARLDQAVTDGKLTQAQADARKDGLTARITDMVNHAPPARGEGDRRGPGPRRGFDGRPNLALVATTLGMKGADVRAQLEAGKTLAQIAGDKTDTLISALVADATTHLDDAVAHGRLTQAEADARKATLQERMTDIVNRTPPIFDGRGPGGPGGPGRPGHPGMKAGPPAGDGDHDGPPPAGSTDSAPASLETA